MDTGTILAIIVGAIVLIGIALLVSRQARERKLDARRNEATELRQEADQRGLQAQRHSAAAEEKAAIAERAEAEAREKAAVANRERAEAEQRAAAADRDGRIAQEHHERASELDPDTETTGDGRFEREQSVDTERR